MSIGMASVDSVSGIGAAISGAGDVLLSALSVGGLQPNSNTKLADNIRVLILEFSIIFISSIVEPLWAGALGAIT